eukprot:TRINITY_DN3311_c2_g10_i1.p1 TRINITY_DN3311_c2_g10~~TRINITY_DN3311_c2_g10_i1.p1  ORF type:complete len:370 (+),score=105.90 TRINITY_DN3311_c2_g10_i1:25-1134(+)
MNSEFILDIKKTLEKDYSNTFWLTPIHRIGSVPTPSFSRQIYDEGIYYGTVGGGAFEYEAQKCCDRGFEVSEYNSKVTRVHLNSKEVEKDIPVCGGVGTVLIEKFEHVAEFLVQMIENIQHGRAFYEIVVVKNMDLNGIADIPIDLPHALMEYSTICSRYIVNELNELTNAQLLNDCQFLLEKNNNEIGMMFGDNFIYIAHHQPIPRLLIFGGGHVGEKVARVGCIAGFSPIVIDDRENIIDQLNFHDDIQKRRMSYENLEELHIKACDFVVIVTHGHRHDLTVISQLMKLPFILRYIGMIGSRRKVSLTFAKLKEMETPQEKIESVRAPIGLAIGGDTAGEIAVAIVAEMILVNTGGSKKGSGCPSTL